MIEEQVVVISTTESGAWVEGIQQSACGSCSAKAGCGQHTMSKLGKKVTLWLPFSTESKISKETLTVGQQIVVGLPEGAILRSTFVLYGVPLAALVLGAIVGHSLGGEVISIISSILSLGLGFKIAGRLSDRNKLNWQPQFLRDCTTSKLSLFAGEAVDFKHTDVLKNGALKSVVSKSDIIKTTNL